MKFHSFLVYFMLLPLVLFFCNATGQTVLIKGTAKEARGKTITLKSYTDNFTFTEQLLAKTVIDSTGNFELTCKIPSTTLAIIHMEYYTGELYIEPNSNLALEIKDLIFNQKIDRINYNLNPLTCYVKVFSEDKNDLNKQIQRLNINYNRFIKDNIFWMKTQRIHNKVDTFLLAMKDTFALANNDFFNAYLKYRLASLKLLTNYNDNRKLLLDYIYQKPILYDNVEYMTFLSNLFDNYFEDLTRPVNLSDLMVPVNTNRSCAEALNVLGKDTLLKNEKLLEIVFLKTLDVLFASTNFNKRAILEVLRQLSNTSKFDTHKLIAKNMITHYTHFDKGVVAPDFALSNTNDSLVKLSSFRGKMVYLNFYASWCVDCIDEMELMKKLYEKYHDDVEFVSISVDREKMNMVYLARDRKYKWTFLHFNNDYDLLEKFGVYSYPSFVLIGADGKYIQCPAVSPSGNIEAVLDEILHPGENKKDKK